MTEGNEFGVQQKSSGMDAKFLLSAVVALGALFLFLERDNQQTVDFSGQRQNQVLANYSGLIQRIEGIEKTLNSRSAVISSITTLKERVDSHTATLERRSESVATIPAMAADISNLESLYQRHLQEADAVHADGARNLTAQLREIRTQASQSILNLQNDFDSTIASVIRETGENLAAVQELEQSEENRREIELRNEIFRSIDDVKETIRFTRDSWESILSERDKRLDSIGSRVDSQRQRIDKHINTPPVGHDA